MMPQRLDDGKVQPRAGRVVDAHRTRTVTSRTRRKQATISLTAASPRLILKSRIAPSSSATTRSSAWGPGRHGLLGRFVVARGRRRRLVVGRAAKRPRRRRVLFQELA